MGFHCGNTPSCKLCSDRAGSACPYRKKYMKR